MFKLPFDMNKPKWAVVAEMRMKQLGIRQVDLTEPLGVKSRGAVGHYLSGRRQLSLEQCKALAKALKMQFEDIFGTDASTANLPQAELAGAIEPWDSKTPLDDDEVEVPFFMEVELAAGIGCTQIQETNGPKLRFSRATLKRQGVDPSSAACVKVSGNSMEPVLPDEAVVGVDTANTTIKDGKMYAIDHDGLLRVKILYRLPGGGIRIKSFNSDEYPDEMLSHEEALQVRVIGKVFWYSVLI